MNETTDWLKELKVGDEVVVFEGDCGYQHIGVVYSNEGLITVSTSRCGHSQNRFFDTDGTVFLPGKHDRGTRLLQATPEAKENILREKLRDEVYRALGPGHTSNPIPLATLKQISALLESANQ